MQCILMVTMTKITTNSYDQHRPEKLYPSQLIFNLINVLLKRDPQHVLTITAFLFMYFEQ